MKERKLGEKAPLLLALAGNPNSGKTTLYNGLTRADRAVGNWPGVTLERIEGSLTLGNVACSVVDLPGIYSLSSDTEEEKVARDFLREETPDLLINVLDASNLERGLELTLQIMEMNVPVLVVLNMMDEAQKKGVYVDVQGLEKRLGVKVIPIVATRKHSVAAVTKAITSLVNFPPPLSHPPDLTIRYPEVIENFLKKWSPSLQQTQESSPTSAMRRRWVAQELLLRDSSSAKGDAEESRFLKERCALDAVLGRPADMVVARLHNRQIKDLCKGIIRRAPGGSSGLAKIDRIIMHPGLGIAIFLGAMYVVFWVTLSFGGAFIDFFYLISGALFVEGLGTILRGLSFPPWIVEILADGVGGGIQLVSTFIPIMFFIFLMLALLEDSGYVVRAAFVMDRFMRRIGLPGKAFIPMILGFGCTVPAVIATRCLDSRRERFIATFMVPFMSCGARLPVYALFGAVFFGRRAGLIVFSLYLVGIVLAVLTGLLLRHTLFKGEFSPFLMELPPYRIPHLRVLLRRSWFGLRQFVVRAGLLIIFVSSLLTFLNSFGKDGSLGHGDTENSILSTIGRSIMPVFAPMGLKKENWPAGVGLFTGIFAKEAIVGTLNSLYLPHSLADEKNEEEGPSSLLKALKEALAVTGENLSLLGSSLIDPLGLGLLGSDQEKISKEIGVELSIFPYVQGQFTRSQAYSYLLFVLIYFPCVAALGTVVKELGKGYGFLLVLYDTLLAWVVAVLFYQGVAGRDPVWVVVALGLLGGIITTFVALSRMGDRTKTLRESFIH